jgi:hypothetical protein
MALYYSCGKHKAVDLTLIDCPSCNPYPRTLKEYYPVDYYPPPLVDPTVKITTKSEVRVTDPLTGGQKNTKPQRFDLIPPEVMWKVAEHYGKGCEKYSDRNWEKGYKWGLSVAALERHLNLWKQGESIDEETGSNHLIAVIWHAIALFIFELRGIGTDDVRTKEGK